MCHVFRCETAARTIANTLRLVQGLTFMSSYFSKLFYFFRDICKKIMIERSVQMDGSNGSNSSTKRAVRPTDLPTENRRRMRHG